MIVKPTTKQIAATSNGSMKLPPGSDFAILGTPKLQANVLVFGRPSTGKTTIATRFAPDPVAFINFDKRAGVAVKRAMDSGRRIYFLGVDIPANVTKLGDEQARKLGQEAVNKVIRNFEWAVEQSRKGNVRTICIDTGTEYSELVNLAITGKTVGVKGDYGKSKDLLNREWWRLYNLAREGNAHLVVLARTKELWENNEPTGNYTYRGPSVMDEGADWSAHIRLRRGMKGKQRKEIELEITKAGNNLDEMGNVYREEDWGANGPFVWSCWMQLPDESTPKDWK